MLREEYSQQVCGGDFAIAGSARFGWRFGCGRGGRFGECGDVGGLGSFGGFYGFGGWLSGCGCEGGTSGDGLDTGRHVSDGRRQRSGFAR